MLQTERADFSCYEERQNPVPDTWGLCRLSLVLSLYFNAERTTILRCFPWCTFVAAPRIYPARAALPSS